MNNKNKTKKHNRRHAAAAAGLLLAVAIVGTAPSIGGASPIKNVTVSSAAEKTTKGNTAKKGNTTTKENAAAKKEVIGTSAAKKKALKNAGLSASEVTFTKAKLKYDDGIHYYDIEFYTGTTEYEYEIDAYTGKVLEKDTEKMKETTDKKSYIGVTRAKEITLKDAGLSASKVDFIKAKLDKDDGKRIYDIEFYYGNAEYEYEIDAYTGKILESDVDYDD